MMMYTIDLVLLIKCSKVIISCLYLEILNGKVEGLFNFFNLIEKLQGSYIIFQIIIRDMTTLIIYLISPDNAKHVILFHRSV